MPLMCNMLPNGPGCWVRSYPCGAIAMRSAHMPAIFIVLLLQEKIARNANCSNLARNLRYTRVTDNADREVLED
jgi:hypothetical protein